MNNLLAVVVGILISIMITLNGGLSNYLGYYTSTLIVHVVGLLSVLTVLIITKNKMKLKKETPFYLFTGGAIGIFIVIFNSICFKNLGASLTLSIALLGQLVLSILIDHFGLFNMAVHKFKSKKLIGLLFISLGIVIMLIY
ncbi:DMT family transporter [Clostridium sp. MSJ-4]|uniref:DMT family transporter n=1 Tax=Clostridium simiarum TaxID=2841506 RepID=A0ABS6F188_9CLOT|nr:MULTISPECIES: DMT family transporter [Clostridium]MBU5592260.1 DMT family transporter [Clostridium simiarum]